MVIRHFVTAKSYPSELKAFQLHLFASLYLGYVFLELRRSGNIFRVAGNVDTHAAKSIVLIAINNFFII